MPFSVSQTNIQTNPINNQTNNTSRPQKTFPGNKEQIPPLHIPLNEMYQRLLSIGQVAPVSLTPSQKSFPHWYKPNQTYEYHAGIAGHKIDGCVAFKRKIIQLVKVRWITFDESSNVNSNPLPNHACRNGGVNTLEIEKEGEAILRVIMERLYEMLKQARHLKIPFKT